MRPSLMSEQAYLFEVAAKQRFLFGTRPTFDLPLGGNRVGDRLKMLREKQSDRTAAFGIARKRTCVVLGNA
jgi:hypothetical protein